jgi:hypothetical protein
MATEAHEMLRKAFKEEALSGLRGSKVEKRALKIIFILGARQQVVWMRMSKKFEKKSMRIVSTQLMRSQKLQV